MQEITCNTYLELLEFLEYDLSYTIEPFIKDAVQTTINIDTTTLEMLQINDLYLNLYCTKYKNKDLNGVTELMCHKIGERFLQEYNNSKYINIQRYDLTERTFNEFKKANATAVLKNKQQLYYENNVIWDWMKLEFC